MSVPDRRARATALLYPSSRSTDKGGASQPGSERDLLQGRHQAFRTAAATAQRVSARPGGARQFVRRVTAKRDKVRHLLWINAISLPNLFGPDAREFAAPRRVEDRRALLRRAERNLDRRWRLRQCRLRAPQRRLRQRESRPPRTLGLWHLQTQRRRRTRAGRLAARSIPHRTRARSDRRETFRDASSARPSYPIQR